MLKIDENITVPVDTKFLYKIILNSHISFNVDENTHSFGCDDFIINEEEQKLILGILSDIKNY